MKPARTNDRKRLVKIPRPASALSVVLPLRSVCRRFNPWPMSSPCMSHRARRMAFLSGQPSAASPDPQAWPSSDTWPSCWLGSDDLDIERVPSENTPRPRAAGSEGRSCRPFLSEFQWWGKCVLALTADQGSQRKEQYQAGVAWSGSATTS